MIKLTHFRIAKFTPTKIGTNITIEVLSEDLPLEVRNEIEKLWKDGNSLAGMMQEIEVGEKKETPISKLAGDLHFTMERYCEKSGINFEEYNKKYKMDNKVQHKHDLSREILVRDIERFKAGIQFE